MPATLADVHYTFGAASVTVTFPEVTAEYPNCVVDHKMRILLPDTTYTWLSNSPYASLANYGNAARKLTVHYTVDNEFSPVDG